MAPRRRGRRTAGSIRRLPSGSYQARVRLEEGRLLPAPETFGTKGAADQWLASVITEQAQGRWNDPRAGEVPLRHFAPQWMKGKVELAPKTQELYDYLLNALFLPTLGGVELVQLTPARIRAWRAGLLRAGRPGPSTIAKAYRLLSSMMSTAVVDNLVARNPCVEKGAGVERAREMCIATPEQVRAIAAAVSPRYRALVFAAAYVGCRWGELAGLRRKNLDIERGTLTVAELRQNNFRNRHWLPALQVAGVEKLRFRDLRHLAGTLATVSDATIREVQARLGHASPAAAYRYQHVLDNRDAQIAERLDGIFRGNTTKDG